MDTSKFDQIAQQFANESTRREAIKRLGALGISAAMVGLLTHNASANNANPRNDNVDQNCLNTCQRHKHHNCHHRCRRKR